MKKQIVITTLAALAAAPLLASAQVTDNTTFGTIPNISPGGQPYSGSGIPYNNSEVTTISGPILGNSTITLAMSATQHGSGNPAPSNNGAGTFYVNTGLNGGRSVWNFDFYINNSAGALSDNDVTYELTEYNVGNGDSFVFDPTIIPDNTGGPASAGNSESLDFDPFGTQLGYDANLNDTYDFTLEALMDGTSIGSSSITVVAGTGASPVPEASTFMAGALMLLPFGIGGVRAIRRKQAKA